MYVKKNSCKSDRILLTLTYDFRENGKIRQKNIETLGYLDDEEKIRVNQKQVVFYSQDYADKAR